MATVKDEKLVEAQSFARRTQFALIVSIYVAIAGTILAVAAAIIWLFFRQFAQLLAMSGILALLAMGGALYYFFYQRGRAQIGIYIILPTYLLVCLTCFYVLPEMGLSIVVGYLITIIMGYLLLGDTRGHIIVAACILALAVDVVLVNSWDSGWFIPLDDTIKFIISAVFSPIALLAGALVIRSIVVGQEKFFWQSRLANLDIERRASDEQKQREYLEEMVQKYVEYVTTVGQGNLSMHLSLKELERDAADPMVILGHNLNAATANLRRMIVQIRDASNSLSSATAEILAATQQQAAGARQQSAAIAQTTTTVDEVKTISEQSIAQVLGVADISRLTVEVSQTGQAAVENTIESMNQIRGRVERIGENTQLLMKKAQQIGEIIASVDDIAAQSKILALNASVEAARAGEHGKGFAVVAVEVRNLAEQSRQATVQINDILTEIQKAIDATVTATGEGARVADEGVQLAAQTQEVIEQLSATIEDSAQSAEEVLASERQQASGVEQIAQAMQSINQAMAQSLASTKQVEKTAQELNELARNLTTVVAQYQFAGEEEINH